MEFPRPSAGVRTFTLALTVVTLAFAGEWYVAAARGADEVSCEFSGKGLTRLPDIPQASGLAASVRTPGVLWSHNDSGDPVILAVDRSGGLQGRVRVAGASVANWEAIAVGPCPNAASCLYVGDVGDNKERRSHITVYRVPEPRPGDKVTPRADAFGGTFPDAPHDTEAMFVTPEGLFVITKDKPAAVFKFPRLPEPGTSVMLQQVGFLPTEAVTDAAASPDGRFVAVRTKEELTFFRTREITAGGTDHSTPFKVARLGEPQGEAVAVSGNGTVYLGGEGGGSKQPGTLAELSCTFPGGAEGRNNGSGKR